MPVDTRISIPFLPQTGITEQILSAISIANEQHARQQQLGVQQQQIGLQQAAQPSEIALRGAQTAEAQQNVASQKLALDMRKREMDYVFGAAPTGEPGAAEQKQGLYSDLQDTKKRLNLNPEESAQFDQAMKSVQVGFLSKGQLDMSPVDKVIQDHLAAQNKKDTDLHPTFRQQGNQWYQDMHTAEGKLAYSVPVPPPSEYLAHSTEGVDYMRTVDAQTGQVTITPITTQKVEKPILPGQPAPSVQSGAPAGTEKGPAGSFTLPGGGKKLSEAGQKMITGLTQATDLAEPAINFLTATKDHPAPSNADWYKAVAKYKFHMDPGPGFADAFQAIGLLRAVATGPLLNGIRNPVIVKGIQEHLPDVTDSPALVKQKIEDLKPFWKQAMQEVYKTENVKAPTGMSDAASSYLQSIGAPH